jgi:hypothetical protein
MSIPAQQLADVAQTLVPPAQQLADAAPHWQGAVGRLVLIGQGVGVLTVTEKIAPALCWAGQSLPRLLQWAWDWLH